MARGNVRRLEKATRDMEAIIKASPRFAVRAETQRNSIASNATTSSYDKRIRDGGEQSRKMRSAGGACQALKARR